MNAPVLAWPAPGRFLVRYILKILDICSECAYFIRKNMDFQSKKLLKFEIINDIIFIQTIVNGGIGEMFRINDVIIYGTQGVCQIVDMEEKTVGGTKKTYYVLKPVNDNGSTIFAPTDNEFVLKKMRRLLSKNEIHKLIDSMPKEDPIWISNENERKERYKEILAGGDHMELIKAIYVHRKEREAEGKRLHMSDERFFKDAEQILYNEFQYVLDMTCKNDLMTYIFHRIEKK